MLILGSYKERIATFLMRAYMVCVLLIFFVLIGFIFIKGITHLNLGMFSWEYNSQNISMAPVIINTLNTVLFSLILAMPLGIFGVIYLSEYGSKKANF